jgi:glycine dehydrogenase subunit 1
MSALGKQGLLDVAKLNVQKAHYAAKRLEGLQQTELTFFAPFFNEFAVKLPEGTSVAQLNDYLLGQGIIGGYDLGIDYPELKGHMLIAVTEQRSREEIDQFAASLEEWL